MSDVKDILGIQRTSTAGDGLGGDVKPAKAKEAKAKRPEGMSREAFALLGDSHPIAPSELANEINKKDDKGLAEKRKGKGPVTWQKLPFANQARSDGLQLEHWTKCAKGAAGNIRPVADGDYPFAKCNKKLMVYRYDEEEWKHLVPAEPGWSRAETDYLLDMCGQFDLRFLAIADRYQFQGGPPRGLEDLKARYYGVARALLVGRAGGEDLIAHEPLVKHPFSAPAEQQRKAALEALFARGKEEEAEEDVVLEQAKAVEARRKQEAAARAPPPAVPAADFVATSDYTDDPVPGVPSLFDADIQPVRPAPGVYLRGLHARETAAYQLTRIAAPARLQKAVESLLTEAGLMEPPRMSTRSICGAWLAARAEAIATVEQRHRGATGGGAAGTPAATPADTPAATPASTPAPSGGDPLAAGTGASDAATATGGGLAASAGTPEGDAAASARTKRSQKGKAPQRHEESTITPRGDKRPRTAKKATDD